MQELPKNPKTTIKRLAAKKLFLVVCRVKCTRRRDRAGLADQGSARATDADRPGASKHFRVSARQLSDAGRVA
jgi:hypothetical protein